MIAQNILNELEETMRTLWERFEDDEYTADAEKRPYREIYRTMGVVKDFILDEAGRDQVQAWEIYQWAEELQERCDF